MLLCCRAFAVTNNTHNQWSAVSASSRLESLLDKTSIVTNVSAELDVTAEPQQAFGPTKLNYYRLLGPAISRFEVTGLVTTHTSTGQLVSSNSIHSTVAYAFIVDEAARRVFVQSHGKLASLDSESKSFWLLLSDLLSTAVARSAATGRVYYVGSDAVGESTTDVFLIEGKNPRRLWIAKDNGIICKAQQQNIICQLHALKINNEIGTGLFSTGSDKELPEISQREIGNWWPTTLGQQSNETSRAQSIHTAALQGMVLAVQQMLHDEKELVNARDEHRRTPLHMAALGDHLEVVKLLLENGADVNSKDEKNETPLWLAAWHGYSDVLNYLIAKGGDINAKGGHGFSALHIAVFAGQLKSSEILLDNGANINETDEAGRKPLDLAMLQQRKDMIDFLRARGAAE